MVTYIISNFPSWCFFWDCECQAGQEKQWTDLMWPQLALIHINQCCGMLHVLCVWQLIQCILQTCSLVRNNGLHTNRQCQHMDGAIFCYGYGWIMHGKAMKAAGSYLPGSFEWAAVGGGVVGNAGAGASTDTGAGGGVKGGFLVIVSLSPLRSPWHWECYNEPCEREKKNLLLHALHAFHGRDWVLYHSHLAINLESLPA